MRADIFGYRDDIHDEPVPVGHVLVDHSVLYHHRKDEIITPHSLSTVGGSSPTDLRNQTCNRFNLRTTSGCDTSVACIARRHKGRRLQRRLVPAQSRGMVLRSWLLSEGRSE